MNDQTEVEVALSTERALHAAWRKRAEEAESEVAGIFDVLEKRRGILFQSPAINSADSDLLDLLDSVIADCRRVRGGV